MISNPLEQFTIHNLFVIKIFGTEIPVTNFGLSMLCSVLIPLLLFLPILSMRNSNKMSRYQAALELLYDMIRDMLFGIAPKDKSKVFAPLIFSLFIFVLSCNLFGLLPMSFTVTSHIAVVFFLAVIVLIFVTTVGFIRQGVGYLSIFLPKGVPLVMAPFLVMIELFAYLARPVGLSIRLTANMTAGHIVLKVLAGFAMISGFFGVFPIALLTIMNGFEIFVSILQAYIFAMLTCVYLGDALNLH